MRFVIDTNRYTDFVNSDGNTLSWFRQADEVFVPFVVVAEIRAGFRNGSRYARNEMLFSEFLANPIVKTLFPDDVTTHVYADLYAQLRRQGRPVPSNDLWIAALSVQHSLPLLTRDKHFGNFPQLMVLK